MKTISVKTKHCIKEAAFLTKTDGTVYRWDTDKLDEGVTYVEEWHYFWMYDLNSSNPVFILITCLCLNIMIIWGLERKFLGRPAIFIFQDSSAFIVAKRIQIYQWYFGWFRLALVFFIFYIHMYKRPCHLCHALNTALLARNLNFRLMVSQDIGSIFGDNSS